MQDIERRVEAQEAKPDVKPPFEPGTQPDGSFISRDGNYRIFEGRIFPGPAVPDWMREEIRIKI